MIRYPVETGCEVISLAGRDAGRRFIVTREIDADFVMMSDGETRPLDRQKKKRRKHLKATGKAFPELIAQLSEDDQLLNAEIRRLLKKEEG